MNKQADPWDDSALLNAFDDAITKYKKMHKKHKPRTPTATDTIQQQEDVEILVKSEEETPHPLPPSDIDPISSKKVESVNDASVVEENHQTDSSSQEPYKQTPDSEHMQEVLGVDKYNELLKQYYELEEQRQTVLQQLQQSGYMNYQYPGEVSGSSGQRGTSYVPEHQNYGQQASNPTIGSYCCSCVCPCSAAPCSSIPVCSFSGYPDSKKDIESIPNSCTKVCEDDTTVKTAMRAAEQAMSSSIRSRHEGTSEGQTAQNVSHETDISVVLNAWYSAGFYTGKYLSEQSASKGKQG